MCYCYCVTLNLIVSCVFVFPNLVFLNDVSLLSPAVGAGTGAAPTSYDYGYGNPAQTYNTAKTYYQQPTAAPTAYPTETHYQSLCQLTTFKNLLWLLSFNVKTS